VASTYFLSAALDQNTHPKVAGDNPFVIFSHAKPNTQPLGYPLNPLGTANSQPKCWLPFSDLKLLASEKIMQDQEL
jgi:hypothetical protein